MTSRALSLLAAAFLASACAHHDVAPVASPQPAQASTRFDVQSTPESAAMQADAAPHGAGASPGTTWESITSNTPPSASPPPPPPDAVSVGLMTISADAAPTR